MQPNELFNIIKSQNNWESVKLVERLKKIEGFQIQFAKPVSKPTYLKVGDIIHNPFFNHFALVLAKSTNQSMKCVMLTTNKNCKEVLGRLADRFGEKDVYYTSTMFLTEKSNGKYYRSKFENIYQISQIKKQIVAIYGK